MKTIFQLEEKSNKVFNLSWNEFGWKGFVWNAAAEKVLFEILQKYLSSEFTQFLSEGCFWTDVRDKQNTTRVGVGESSHWKYIETQKFSKMQEENRVAVKNLLLNTATVESEWSETENRNLRTNPFTCVIKQKQKPLWLTTGLVKTTTDANI